MIATYRSLYESSAPAAEPITLAEAKLHLHVTHSIEDSMIEEMISIARRELVAVTCRSLVNTTWVQRMESFPDEDELILARSPVSSVTSVAYVNSTGTSATMTATTDYLVDTYTIPGRIYLAPTASWPNTYGEPNDVTITYVAGYGAAATAVPGEYKHLIKLIVGDLYTYRERFAAGETITELATFVRMLMNVKAEFVF